MNLRNQQNQGGLMENPIPQSTVIDIREARDLANFIGFRPALPSDDLAIAELLVRTFLSTYEQKLPSIITTDDRKNELRNVGARRKQGHVCVAELGYRIIGTFSLIHPESPNSDAWRSNGANLRCLAIDPEFHGLALSELLLKESERIAKAWHSEAVYLHVQKGAAKVAMLYERNGYLRDEAGDKFSFGSELEGHFKPLLYNQNYSS